MKRFLFSIIFISALFACNNDLSLDNVKEDKNENRFIIKANIDTEYEYADDNTRIGITADDAPRVILNMDDFPENNEINNHSLKKTNIRVMVAAFKYSTNPQGFGHLDEYNVLPNTKDIVRLEGGKGNYTIYFDRKDDRDRNGVFQPWPNAVWSMAITLGGYWGNNDKFKTPNDHRLTLFFAKDAFGKENTPAQFGNINRQPNEKIVQIIGDNYTKRHFPLISRFHPAKADKKAPAGQNWGKWDEPNKDNLYVGRDKPIKIEPRGTIFTFRLKNETGKNIKVTHIESPYRNGFAFEGYFQGLYVNPIKSDFGSNKNFDPAIHWDSEAAKLPFHEVASYPNAPSLYGSFPVYADETTQGYEMAPDQISEGKFLVWAYPMNGGNTRFRVRVRYEVVGEAGSHESVPMEVPLPASGSYEDGKAYRSMLIIK